MTAEKNAARTSVHRLEMPLSLEVELLAVETCIHVRALLGFMCTRTNNSELHCALICSSFCIGFRVVVHVLRSNMTLSYCKVHSHSHA